MNIKNEGATAEKFFIFETLQFKMGKWTENELTTPLRNVYLKSCIHLKSENVNIEIKGAACENFCIFQILHFKIGKWTSIELTSPK